MARCSGCQWLFNAGCSSGQEAASSYLFSQGGGEDYWEPSDEMMKCVPRGWAASKSNTPTNVPLYQIWVEPSNHRHPWFTGDS